MNYEKDFLRGYEIKTWEFSTRIYKIIGAAAVLNLTVLFLFAQTNMLGVSACDSPFVNRVCQVLDTVYVGSKLFNGSSPWVDEDYDKTKINPADVVWVPEDGISPPIEYPSGYFQVANRDEIAAREAMIVQQDNGFGNATASPFIPSSDSPSSYTPPPTSTFNRKYTKPKSNGGLISKKQNLPKKQTGSIIDGEIEDDIALNEEDPKKEKTDAEKEAEKQKNSIEENTAKDSDPVSDGIAFNRKPLDDYTDNVVTQWDKKQIDLTKNFEVTLISKLTEDGKLAEGKKFIRVSGDDDIAKVAIDALLAISDSGFLGYLKTLDIDDIKLTLKQDDEKISMQLISNQKTSRNAISTARGLRGSISLAKGLVKTEDEKFLLDKASVTNDGRNLIMIVDIPKDVATKMMNDQLKSALAKRNEKKGEKQPSGKPNGTTESKATGKNSSK